MNCVLRVSEDVPLPCTLHHVPHIIQKSAAWCKVLLVAQFVWHYKIKSFDLIIHVPIVVAFTFVLFRCNNWYMYIWFVPMLADMLYHVAEPIIDLTLLDQAQAFTTSV